MTDQRQGREQGTAIPVELNTTTEYGEDERLQRDLAAARQPDPLTRVLGPGEALASSHETGAPFYDELIARYRRERALGGIAGQALDNPGPIPAEAQPKLSYRDLRLKVVGFLTSTGQQIENDINNAIAQNATAVNGDPFKTLVERKQHYGFISHAEAAALVNAIRKLEIERNNLEPKHPSPHRLT